MSGIVIEPWEPEESVGKLWHALASRFDAPLVHDGARVALSEIGGRLAILFRGLGGSADVEIKPVAEEVTRHRLSFLRRLGTETEKAPRASFDGEVLRLPQSLGVFPIPEANAGLYIWLAASAAHAPARQHHEDPLQADLADLMAARSIAQATFENAPGFRRLYHELCDVYLALRPVAVLPKVEATVEALIRHELGDEAPLLPEAVDWLGLMQENRLPDVRAPRGYRSCRPVPLWLSLRAVVFSAGTEVENREAEGAAEDSAEEEGMHRAARHRADLANRGDSLILHKFEAILSWAEFLNLNRRVEDDDLDTAKKAVEDQDEIGLGQTSKAPATRLKLHLDLAPEDVDRERLSGVCTYPEWDVRTGGYLPDHVKVLASAVDVHADLAGIQADPTARRRIKAVKRQFEALRPSRISLPGFLDGDELDMDAVVRSMADFSATGESRDRVWRQSRPLNRNLAVSILLDVSRSTESAVDGRSVIDIEREALTALAWGLDACGDDFAIHAFSSLKRDRVYVLGCKEFGQPMSEEVESRITALKPGFYTRLGAAIRHVSADLARQSKKRRLLLVITDGKPNDLDHYEGRHGIEDSAMAVREARRAGQSVFGITVDKDGKSWFPRMFGQGGYALIPHADHLTTALPQIYRQLVGA